MSELKKSQVSTPDDASVGNHYQCRTLNSSATGNRSDAKELKDKVSFRKLLKLHGNQLTPTENGHKCTCPFHLDIREQLYVHSNDSSGRCYGCGWRGDIYDYLSKKHDIGFREAIDELQHLADKIQRREEGVNHVHN